MTVRLFQDQEDGFIKIWDRNDNFKWINNLLEESQNSTSLLQLKDGKVVSG